jgi:hypothetical protein
LVSKRFLAIRLNECKKAPQPAFSTDGSGAQKMPRNFYKGADLNLFPLLVSFHQMRKNFTHLVAVVENFLGSTTLPEASGP